MRCVHFVGITGEKYWSAVKVWGAPHYVHPCWDVRALQEYDPETDIVIFAKHEYDPPNLPRR